jgi:hypothetical protein
MKDAEFMTAKEKKLVLKQWETFFKNGLKWDNFTGRLYQHLILHCAFIAHYSREGFYNYYFTTGKMAMLFMSQFDNRNALESVEYGKNGWIKDNASGDYEDINRAMVEVASKYIPTLMSQAYKCQKDSDITAAQRILDKYGMEIKR